MVGSVIVRTGIRKDEPLSESIQKIDRCVGLYGMERVMDRVLEFREYPWVGHVRLRENCDCLACRLEGHLFKMMERPFSTEIPREEQPIEKPLFTGREPFYRPKW